MTTRVMSTETNTFGFRSDDESLPETLDRQGERESSSTLQSVQPPDDGAEYVEGLPLGLVKTYAEIAVRHAVVRELEPGQWLASVVGFEGAWGDGDSPHEALLELDDAIIAWVVIKRRLGARNIPTMEGIDLNPLE